MSILIQGENIIMIEYAFDKTADQTAPPTRESIEEVRIQQLEALKAIRRKLLEVQWDSRPAA